MRIAGFYDNSCTNGDGWRSVLFVGGCPHQCKGCHNKNTWNFDYGEKVEDINCYIKRILDNKKLIDGVTLSGGEPFQPRNIKHLIKLTKEVKKHGLNIWCYSGYKFEDLKNNKTFYPLLKELDVLIDGKFQEELFSPQLKFRGSENQRIIDIKKSLKMKEIIELTS